MVFTVLVLFTFMVNAQHTFLEIPVENWWDDGEEVVLPNDQGELLGELDVGSSDLEMPFDHSGQIVGLLFRNVKIEPGQTIVSAYIQFTSDDDEQADDNPRRHGRHDHHAADRALLARNALVAR